MRATTMAVILGGLLANLWVLPTPAEAGIVVLKNGEVIVGRIRVEEDDREKLIVRWPYLERTERGHVEIPHFRIRWYDRDADEPTDEFWQMYSDQRFPLDNRWNPLFEKWQLRQQSHDDMLHVPVILDDGSSAVALALIPHKTTHFEIQKPEGWSKRVEDGIMIFESDSSGIDGFKARIHVFAVDSVQETTYDDQAKWIETEVRRIAPSRKDFDMRESDSPNVVTGGCDMRSVTSTTVAGRTVFALRDVRFRVKRTYFFTAYAHESEFNRLKKLFQASASSLKILEDEAGGGDTEVSDEKPAGGN